MLTFALVSEGVCDQAVIEHLIQTTCEKILDCEIEVYPMQPLRDATDSSANFGGWERVFEFCETGIPAALSVNDYVVIQIDTDRAEHVKLGVSLQVGGVDRDIQLVTDDVVRRIASCFAGQIPEELNARVIYAVSIHSIESWLLLLLFEDDHPKNSFDRLERGLRRSNIKLVKTYDCYSSLIRPIKFKKILGQQALGNSLSIFLQRVAAITA